MQELVSNSIHIVYSLYSKELPTDDKRTAQEAVTAGQNSAIARSKY